MPCAEHDELPTESGGQLEWQMEIDEGAEGVLKTSRHDHQRKPEEDGATDAARVVTEPR